VLNDRLASSAWLALILGTGILHLHAGFPLYSATIEPWGCDRRNVIYWKAISASSRKWPGTEGRKGECPMKRVLIVLALLLVLAVAAVPVAAITWGQPDTAHTNVGAMVVDWPGYGPYPVCSGTLIHPRLFLTAGHCTTDWDEYGVDTFWVNVDQNAVNAESLLEVEQVITHPDYDWGAGANNPRDVGILILAEAVEGIAPATLPEVGYLDRLRKEGWLGLGQDKPKFTVVGYGGSLDWPPPDIYYEDIRQVAQSEFRALLHSFIHMSQHKVTGDGGTCFGDSGGPAFWTQDDGSEILVGITSWGDPYCISTGFNYRVDIPETLTFIDDVLTTLEP
jgi:hypothetical protein